MNRNERIAWAISYSGKKKSLIAKEIKVSPSAITQWLDGTTTDIKLDYLYSLEESTGVLARWMATGNGPRLVENNIEDGPDTGGSVPLISWVAAGGWKEVSDPYSTGEAEMWLPCPVKHSNRTFVLRVRGESMYNPLGKPSLADGDLIFVDPLAEARHKSLVVVRLDDTSEAQFKQLIEEGGKRYLKALNPAWPTQFIEVNNNATICGVVIFYGAIP